MTDPIRIAAVQMAMGPDRTANLLRAISSIERAAVQGAQLIALPELFSAAYFPQLPTGRSSSTGRNRCPGPRPTLWPRLPAACTSP